MIYPSKKTVDKTAAQPHETYVIGILDYIFRLKLKALQSVSI